ncbi:hypothetical protein L1D14_07300 [Vibrio tubiashii]|uniref:hypothetical protein n=1 Tax=Vibrio tubiashii TaxID=29498 RepID=UPI001EFE26D9|nr:hypothetical protein [Vibrio tubiashii]MCG9576043.1 hypothetical protein [Vibrio tubiashii]
MSKSIALTMMLLTTLLSASVIANDEYCMYGDQKVPLDETVSHEDPVIVHNIRTQMSEAGYTEEQIEKELSYNDWTVVHLKCVRTFGPNPDYSPEKALAEGRRLGMIKVTGYALLPVSHQIQWVERKLNLTKTTY